ncbi:MAG: MBL fold metallo-hydrolase [Candidatus Riflebacteria bacterium]|nr:MBL fold metallo-hydrolase [Candidatus Riflebacteria bacterium]
MTQNSHIRIGSYDVYLLSGDHLKWDGGSVFGIIPRSAWAQKLPPDDRNRVTLGVNQLLVKGPDFLALVDTGVGTRLTERQREVRGAGHPRPWAERLAPLGLTPADVTHVIFTHLHTDHAGGATVFSDDRQEVLPAFPRAAFLVQEGEWQDACAPPDGEANAYRFADFLPLLESGRLVRLRGNQRPLPGVFLQVTGGHTRHHQMVRITDGQDVLFFPGDICPTPFHLGLSWKTSYDQFPLETLAARRNLLGKALGQDVLVVFSHDPRPAFRRLTGSLEHPTTVACDAPA